MDAKVLDHEPGIGEDGSDGDGFGKATYCWRGASVTRSGFEMRILPADVDVPRMRN
jgi:hypothetical protein